MLYNIIISPIELLIELLFSFFYKPFESYGLSILGISISVSLMTLPLYHAAEKLQKKERDKRISLQDGIARIKSTFTGDEQYLMLSTYYRQNNYHPLYALRNSFNLIIQVPFFIAAYHFLSNLSHLNGEGFFFIKNLGQPDGLIVVGGMAINLLPLLMTAINLIAGAIYTKGFPLRDKAQLYGMAGIFLILLYSSPSGLVLYWTCNNTISLIKTLFYKAKRPLLLLYLSMVFLGVGFTVTVFQITDFLPLNKQLILYAGCALIILIPVFLGIGKRVYKRYLAAFSENKKQVALLFILSVAILWIICGFVIPGNLMLSSPIEFAFTGAVSNPLSYMVSNGVFFFGMFILWPLLIYGLSGKQMRVVVSVGVSVVAIGAILNLLIFKGDYGLISRVLLFDEPSRLESTSLQTVIPIICMVVCALLVLFVIRIGFAKLLINILSILLLASSSIGLYGAVGIQKAYTEHTKQRSQNAIQTSDDLNPVISLSREEENVVVLFLDRAINSYLPIIFEQFPELYEQYSGFTYYPNTVTPGVATLLGAPPIMGGYEYVPEALNERDTELLVDKHNESMLVLPKLFLDAGYHASVFDPPYSNYKWSNDYTPFMKYPEITVKTLDGVYSYRYKAEHSNDDSWGPDYESRTIKRRFPVFSLMKIMVPALRELFYYEGTYFLMGESAQNITKFIDAYAVLHYLPQLTALDSPTGSYIFIANDTTHEPILLQAPEYEPRIQVTDSYSPLQEEPGYTLSSQAHYHANVAALRQIGVWLEFLKEEGVYDNTRIIIVSDHGNSVQTPAFEQFSTYGGVAALFNSLLLHKDFHDRAGFATDMEFMTTADVPLLAIKDLPVSTANPFTGVDMLSMVDKDFMRLYGLTLDPTTLRHGTFTFEMSGGYVVEETIFDEANWAIIDGSE